MGSTCAGNFARDRNSSVIDFVCSIEGISDVKSNHIKDSGNGSPSPGVPLNVGSFCCSSGMLYPRNLIPYWDKL